MVVGKVAAGESAQAAGVPGVEKAKAADLLPGQKAGHTEAKWLNHDAGRMEQPNSAGAGEAQSRPAVAEAESYLLPPGSSFIAAGI